ncbi:uncharacterized protein METZ01_LOCUS385768, partial [marine metagenome]
MNNEDLDDSDPQVDSSGRVEDSGSRVEPYESLASIYDHVMGHVDYGHWVRYIDNLLRDVCENPRQLIELACGTGNATFALADLAYDVRGYD